MAHRARVEFEGTVYHIPYRGDRREVILAGRGPEVIPSHSRGGLRTDGTGAKFFSGPGVLWDSRRGELALLKKGDACKLAITNAIRLNRALRAQACARKRGKPPLECWRSTRKDLPNSLLPEKMREFDRLTTRPSPDAD
jgi:hypothetical protein